MKSAVPCQQQIRRTTAMTRKMWKWVFAVSLFTATVASVPAVGQNKLSTPPAGPSVPVTVVNGTGQPVPTAAQGTTNVAGTVNVGNSPSVHIANTPNVNIANTPSVSIAGTPTVTLAPGGSTNVTNPTDNQNNPAPLAVLESAQPYEDACVISIIESDNGSCAFLSIPSGKRLVIKEVDALETMSTGVRPFYLLLTPGSTTH